MSRFVQEATASGVASDTLGSGSTTFCGDGSQLYDVPGAFTPILVCCNWDTPISGPIEIDVNFSCYDCVVAVFHGTHNCCNGQSYWILPSNAGIDACICCSGCYCSCNLWQCNLYSGYNCNFRNSTAKPETNGQFCWRRSTRIEYQMQPGAIACEYCGDTGVIMKSIAWHEFCTVRKDFNTNPSCLENYPGCWPSKKVDTAKLGDRDFCKIVMVNAVQCFMPYMCCCSSYTINGAMYGVWGVVRSNPYVDGKSKSYPS